MTLPIILISLGLVILALFLIVKTRKYCLKAVYLKAICSLIFIAVGLYSAFSVSNHIFPPFVIMGLVCGLLGDILLDLKYVYKEDDRLYTYGGFIAFGIGHILYVTGLYLEFYHGESVLYFIIPLIAAILMAPASLLMEKMMKYHYGEFKLVASSYCITLFMTAFSAISLLILSNFASTSLIMLSIGGILFAASDLILCGTYFGENRERPIDIILNTCTYYLAQYLIAFSIYFL